MLEPGERVERYFLGWSNRWWVLFTFLGGAATRYVVLTDRNLYLCRGRLSRRTPIEVFVKQPLGCATLSLERRRLQVGPEHFVWVPWLPWHRWMARKLVSRVNEQQATETV